MNRKIVYGIIFLGVGLCLQAEAQQGDNESLPVGLRKQLLVDDYIIAEKSQVRRGLEQAKKENKGKPIYVNNCEFYGSVLYDEGKFKLYHRYTEGVTVEAGYGYAESTDGINFEHKATLSGIPFAGDINLSVMVDPHESDPKHRYKASFDAVGMAAGLAYSADGIHWKAYNEGKPVTHRAADTYNQIIWDEEAKVYRLFTRTDYPGPIEVRGTRDMINPDVKADPTNWKKVREWKFGKGPDDEIFRRQIYALTDWIYEGVHFGLMHVYEFPHVSGYTEDRTQDLFNRHERDVCNFYIGTTRGNAMWDLTWVYAGKPLVERGPDGSFDKDMIMHASEIITHNDKHWIYYGAWRERHGVNQGPRAIGLATLELDRFIYLEAKGGEWGTVITKPFKLAGSRLQVNVDAEKGRIGVEVLDAAGKPMPGFSGKDSKMYKAVNELRLEPKWGKSQDLGRLKGKVIRLKFRLNNARLYAFKVNE